VLQCADSVFASSRLCGDGDADAAAALMKREEGTSQYSFITELKIEFNTSVSVYVAVSVVIC